MSIEYHVKEYDRKNIRGYFAATGLDTGGVLSAKTLAGLSLQLKRPSRRQVLIFSSNRNVRNG